MGPYRSGIPGARRGGNKRTADIREVVNGLMYVLGTGCQWRANSKDLPPRSKRKLIPTLRSGSDLSRRPVVVGEVVCDGYNECSYEGSHDGCKSSLPEHVEVRVWSERQRWWSSKDKLVIVRETLAPGSVAQVVADRHGIGMGLIYTWRKQMLKAAMAGFAVVEIKPDPPAQLPRRRRPPKLAPAAIAPPLAPSGVIQVELSSGSRLRVGSDVDGAALERVLAVLSAP